MTTTVIKRAIAALLPGAAAYMGGEEARGTDPDAWMKALGIGFGEVVALALKKELAKGVAA